MVDRIDVEITQELGPEQLDEIVARNKLETLIQSAGATPEYRTGARARLSGVEMKITPTMRGYSLSVRCSLHKLYNRYGEGGSGRLENTTLFTMEQARYTILEVLPQVVGFSVRDAAVSYVEIGATLPVKYPPPEYIARMIAIAAKARNRNDETAGYLFQDATYKNNRQKTTSRTKDIRTVYKVYDKGHELTQKRNRLPVAAPNLLRIETAYKRPRRQAVTEFFTAGNMWRLYYRFLEDWATAVFRQNIQAPAGTKQVRKQWAAYILQEGLLRFTESTQTGYADGNITRDAYRARKEFADKWPEQRRLYALYPSEYETDFRAVLAEVLNAIKPQKTAPKTAENIAENEVGVTPTLPKTL